VNCSQGKLAGEKESEIGVGSMMEVYEDYGIMARDIMKCDRALERIEARMEARDLGM